MNNFVKIKGNINPVLFMNKLVSKIYDKFEIYISFHIFFFHLNNK